ncbi:MAG: hypothetical protein UZ17_ACD001002775 [Acidobacteria bacterium OLB17]|nr:MAG: hypothetical protein UZ17_ACD001002775 [Acidobacteria bacterium OLB17]
MIRHSEPRYTKDLDLWVATDAENADRLFRALTDFGAPLGGLTPSDFTRPEYFYTMGQAPGRIDILLGADGLEFEDCWTRRNAAMLGGSEIYYISREDLITNKEAVGRLQDLADVEKLRDTRSEE